MPVGVQTAVNRTVYLCTVAGWNGNTRSNREKTRRLPTSQDLIHARDGQLTESADIIKLLKSTVIRTPLDVFRMTTKEAELGEVECWIRPAARYCLRVASTSLAKIGLMR